MGLWSIKIIEQEYGKSLTEKKEAWRKEEEERKSNQRWQREEIRGTEKLNERLKRKMAWWRWKDRQLKGWAGCMSERAPCERDEIVVGWPGCVSERAPCERDEIVVGWAGCVSERAPCERDERGEQWESNAETEAWMSYIHLAFFFSVALFTAQFANCLFLPMKVLQGFLKNT